MLFHHLLSASFLLRQAGAASDRRVTVPSPASEDVFYVMLTPLSFRREKTHSLLFALAGRASGAEHVAYRLLVLMKLQQISFSFDRR